MLFAIVFESRFGGEGGGAGRGVSAVGGGVGVAVAVVGAAATVFFIDGNAGSASGDVYAAGDDAGFELHATAASVPVSTRKMERSIFISPLGDVAIGQSSATTRALY